MLLRRHRACRLCISKVLYFMPAVRVDLPSLYCYSTAFGKCRGGCIGLRVRRRQKNLMCEPRENNAGVPPSAHGERGAALLWQRLAVEPLVLAALALGGLVYVRVPSSRTEREGHRAHV